MRSSTRRTRFRELCEINHRLRSAFCTDIDIVGQAMEGAQECVDVLLDAGDSLGSQVCEGAKILFARDGSSQK